MRRGVWFGGLVVACATACTSDPAAQCGTSPAPAICEGPRTVITLDATPDTGSYVNVFTGETFLGQAIPSGTIEIARDSACTGEQCAVALCAWDVSTIPGDLVTRITLEGAALGTWSTPAGGAVFPTGAVRALVTDMSDADASYCSDRPFTIAETATGVWDIWIPLAGTGDRTLLATLRGSSP